MIVFASEQFKTYAQELVQDKNMISGAYETSYFLNGEMYIRLHTDVKDQECVIVDTISPPDKNLFSLLLLVHTLKKEGARSVHLFAPYLAYMRHDKVKSGESLATHWIGSILKKSGVNKVITFDLHSPKAEKLFPIPIVSLSTAKLFAPDIKSKGLSNASVIAPDNGAVTRAQAVVDLLGVTSEVLYFDKQRNDKGIILSGPNKKAGERVILVDDVLDTGATLVEASKQLYITGTREIYIYVTHGLFIGTEWKKLLDYGLQSITCTDTIPNIPSHKSISVLSTKQLMIDYYMDNKDNNL